MVGVGINLYIFDRFVGQRFAEAAMHKMKESYVRVGVGFFYIFMFFRMQTILCDLITIDQNSMISRLPASNSVY